MGNRLTLYPSSQTIFSVSILLLSCRLNRCVPNESFLSSSVTKNKCPWGNSWQYGPLQVASRCPQTELPLMSARLVPAFADRGCQVVGVTDPYGSILAFLDRNRYFLFQVALQLYSRGWVNPVPGPLFLRKFGSAGNRTRDLLLPCQNCVRTQVILLAIGYDARPTVWVTVTWLLSTDYQHHAAVM
jgi:hypothetical protein